MTQDYEPIKITESTPEPADGSFYFLTDTDDDYLTIATVTEDGWFLPGYESEFFWEEIRDKHIGWRIQSLAAHDAQIRAEALELSDKEHDIATQAIIDSLTSSDRNDYGIASESAFEAVSEHRKEQRQ
ncbi:hypothetical protein [Bifidobacterium crudilactis]|uniref:hypothetical protein n=1 Tax=Bifidobacterium crudilactis TaxID=327277 RepID=UPI002647D708|nr:hypothetical protein [Bifidobacterium crudilactis]MDN5971842.1 hypothetical protein [Bifidobacterium crudilactis]MDN6001138.1 hypothetical protein [Bifidobacterium crudilactis]MDN6466686.1 hypothetical protein [Bifidobacterium crudilactis]MDN6558103.1 hypothetical protein [Bifidobacterium crudilactis]MDN6773457.1 hypothetical protein [Bifidobacterium crudilactis]